MSDAGSTTLIFQLDGEAFALPVENVLEIVDPAPMTPVPNADVLAPGLVNVRGAILPVFDIRRRLGLARRGEGMGARMVVYDAQFEGQPLRLAFEADAVDRVLDLESAESAEFPELAALWPAECIAGAVSFPDDALVVRLNPEELFTFSHAAQTAIHEQGMTQ